LDLELDLIPGLRASPHPHQGPCLDKSLNLDWNPFNSHLEQRIRSKLVCGQK